MRYLILLFTFLGFFTQAQTEVYNTILGEIRLNLLDKENMYQMEYNGNPLHTLEYYSKDGDFATGTYHWSYGGLTMTYTVVPVSGGYKIDYLEPQSYLTFLEGADFINDVFYFKIHKKRVMDKVVDDHFAFAKKEEVMKVMVTDQLALLMPEQLEVRGPSNLDSFQAFVRFDEDDFERNREAGYPEPLDMIYDLNFAFLQNDLEIEFDFKTLETGVVTLLHHFDNVAQIVHVPSKRMVFDFDNSNLTLNYVSDELGAYDVSKVNNMKEETRTLPTDVDELTALTQTVLNFAYDMLTDKLQKELQSVKGEYAIDFKKGEINQE